MSDNNNGNNIFYNNFFNINIVTSAEDTGKVLHEVLKAITRMSEPAPEPKPEPEPEEEEESSSEEEEEEAPEPEEGEEAKPEEEEWDPPGVEEDWRVWDHWIRYYSEEYIKRNEEKEKIHNEDYEYRLDEVDWVPPPNVNEEGWKRLAAWVECYSNAWINEQMDLEEAGEVAAPAAKRAREWWCGHHYENKKEK